MSNKKVAISFIEAALALIKAENNLHRSFGLVVGNYFLLENLVNRMCMFSPAIETKLNGNVIVVNSIEIPMLNIGKSDVGNSGLGNWIIDSTD